MKRTEWILGGILTVLVILIAGLLLLSWFRPENGLDPDGLALQLQATSVFEGRGARVAFGNAQAAAVAWDASAQLNSATATWPPDSDFATGEATWTFTFYAPAQRRTALISVVEDEAKLVSSRGTTRETLTMTESDWQIDSQTIIETLLQSGGRDFLDAQNGVTLVLTLSAGERATWEAVLFSPISSQSFNLEFDATTGEIIQP